MVERNNKHAFWQALVVAVIVFGVGILLGFFLESYRSNEIQLNIMAAEINVLDEQLRNKIIENFDVNCELATKSSFSFADKIYLEAEKLERYDEASKFTETLLVLHKRYDLLRALLWTEIVDLKERCNEDFHTVVYFYDYGTENIDISSKQLFYSRLLFDLKSKYPDEVILIPIAIDTGLESVRLLVENYNIDEFPAIVVDEYEIIDGIITFEELEEIVFKKSSI